MGERVDQGIYDSPEVQSLLIALGRDIQQHFALEEGCMSQHHCPMAQKNKAEHAQLQRIYLDFLSEFNKTKSLELLAEFHRTAECWLLEHICYVDIHLRSCVGVQSHGQP